MAKNKAKAQPEEELIGKDEVVYEEEKGGQVTGEAQQSVFEKYRTYFIVGGVGVLVAVIFLVMRMGGGEKKNEAGQTDMINAVLAFENGPDSTLGRALAGDGQMLGFENIASDYGRTDAGRLAHMYSGLIYLTMGNLDEGYAELEEYGDKGSMVAAAGLAARAYVHEQKGEFAEAAEMYVKASRTPAENDYSTPYYLMHAARNHESAGDNEAALEIYVQIKEKYPLSQEATSIDRYIARLSPEDNE